MDRHLKDFTIGASVEVRNGIAKTQTQDFEGAIPHFLSAIRQLNSQVENLRQELLTVKTQRQLHCSNLASANGGKQDDEKMRIAETIEACIERDVNATDLHSLVNLEKPIKDMVSSITLPCIDPTAFEFGVKPFNTFLLFGLPGTGKTKFAKAVASYCNKFCKTTFFNASASRLMSKWQGESEKALLQLFRKADSEKKSIIFFDEVDELLSEKKNSDSDTSSRLKSLFLTCTDGINDGLKNTIIIAATNRPWILEGAAWSRFQRKYYVSLPNEINRKSLFKNEIGRLPSVVTDQDLTTIAKKTNCYAGRDIKSVVMSAWMLNLQENRQSCESKTKHPPLTMNHLLGAIREIKPSVREVDKTAMEDFLINEFGGVRKFDNGKSRPTFSTGA